MIAKNELRLGNIVGFVMESNLCYVSVIDEEGFITTTGISNNRGEYNAERGEEDMMPIPLTPEILEKAGFDEYMSNPRLETFLVNKQSYYPFLLHIGRDGRVYYNENLEVRYVHQLQNIYVALTNKELEIAI